MARPTSYVKVDNSIGTNPKFMQIADEHYLEAVGLYVLMLGFCDRGNTDGIIKRNAVSGMRGLAPGRNDVIDCLIDANLMCVKDGEIHIKDYLEWQRSKEEKVARKEQGKAAADASWKARRYASGNAVSNAVSNAQESIGEEKKTLTPSSSGDDDAFARFWREYPRKVAKIAASKAWAKAVKTTEPETIIAALKAYRFDTRDEGQYVPHPSTWLNQGRWEDEAVPFEEPEPKERVICPNTGEVVWI